MQTSLVASYATPVALIIASVQNKSHAALSRTDVIQGCFPRLKHIWVDAGYRGKLIAKMKLLHRLTLEVVKHPWSDVKRGVWLPKDAEPPVIPSGFHVLPRRWVVERTFAWFGLSRRLSRDYETRLDISEGMIYGAMIRIMIRRIARHEPS